MHRPPSKTMQLLLAHALIVLLVAAPMSVFAWIVQQGHWKNIAEQRIEAVARSVASLPGVQDALTANNSAVATQSTQVVNLGATIEAIRVSSGMEYIVVANPAGIRLTHVLPGRVGESVSTDPGVALAGQVFVGVEDGEVGRTFRVKVPVHNETGAIIGVVSAGVLEHDLISAQRDESAQLAIAIAGALLAGGLAAAGSSYVIRRRIYGIEPTAVAPLQAQLTAERNAAEMLRANTHEFANRLHVIQGLLSQGRSDAAQSYISSLPGAARGEPDAAEVVGQPLLDAVLTAKQALAREAGVTLTLDVESDASELSYEVGDAEVTVLSNLVTNALEACETTVLVGVFGSAAGLSIVVQDDGAGVAATIDPFSLGVSTKANDRGVGLALVQHIVTDRSGQLRYGSGALGGAEFEVFLKAPNVPVNEEV